MARPATGRPGGRHASADVGASGLLSLSGHSEVFRGVAPCVGGGPPKLRVSAFVAKSGIFLFLWRRVVLSASADWQRGVSREVLGNARSPETSSLGLPREIRYLFVFMAPCDSPLARRLAARRSSRRRTYCAIVAKSGELTVDISPPARRFPRLFFVDEFAGRGLSFGHAQSPRRGRWDARSLLGICARRTPSSRSSRGVFSLRFYGEE